MVQNNIKRKPGRPRKFDSEKVLDGVLELFWEFGYEATDTDTLCKHTGLSKPSLYNAFGSKEDIFVAAINRYRQTCSVTLFEGLNKADTASEGIRDYFLELAENVAGEGHPAGCLITSIAMPLCDRLPKVAAALSGMPEEGYERMVAYFDSHKHRGKLPESFDSGAAVSVFQDLSLAMIMQARLGAPLEMLKKKATRNAQHVMFEGNGTAWERNTLTQK